MMTMSTPPFIPTGPLPSFLRFAGDAQKPAEVEAIPLLAEDNCENLESTGDSATPPQEET
jgi:hypothetical protein